VTISTELQTKYKGKYKFTPVFTGSELQASRINFGYEWEWSAFPGDTPGNLRIEY
jgi:hypothetical protein